MMVLSIERSGPLLIQDKVGIFQLIHVDPLLSQLGITHQILRFVQAEEDNLKKLQISQLLPNPQPKKKIVERFNIGTSNL